MEIVSTEEKENGIMSLTRGMMGDAHQLAQQELALVKGEFRRELDKLKMAYFGLAITMGVVFAGLVPLPFLLSDLLLYLTSYALPVWVARLGASTLFIVLGIAAFLLAKKRRLF